MTVNCVCDLRELFGAIRDQGDRPTCTAFATSDAHTAARGDLSPLSVEHLYYHAVRRTPGGHPDDGVTLSYILEALQHDGQAAETGWPYIPKLPSDLSLWTPPRTATPAYVHSSVMPSNVISEVLKKLDTGTPVILTLLISEVFSRCEQGLVTIETSDADVDWHAVIAVGYGRAGSKLFLLIRNSWGQAWGLAGHAWLDTDYVALRLGGIAVMA